MQHIRHCRGVRRRDSDQAWLDRHRWWPEACVRLFEDQAAVPLGG
jgi:hypothetical protein